MNDLIEKRRSIRSFQPDKSVTREQINRLLAAAMAAPSAHNSRPWEFIVVTKRETLDEIARIHPHAKMFLTAAAGIIVVTIPKAGKAEGFFPQDCAAATQNILLEAVAMGLGTCWCGVYPKENHVAAFRDFFNIPGEKMPFNAIAIGIPNEAPGPRGYFDESIVRYID